MNIFKHLLKPPPLSVAVAFMIAMVQPLMVKAQVVQVPIGNGCVVVVPGTGGSIALNQVGDGGVVTMPDPYAGGYFTFSGALNPVWSLLGDLSYYGLITPPTPPLQGSTAAATVIILSYNKNVRSSEEMSNWLARSKGRVTVAYTQGSCNNKMSFDVYKKWGDPPVHTPPHSRYVPPIVGPSCWGEGPFTAPNHLITFSVDQVSSCKLPLFSGRS